MVELKEQQGFIALITVLIISAVALMIGLDVSLFSIGEANMSSKKIQSSQSYYLANLCAEKALRELRKNSAYQGNENLVFPEGQCSILPIEGNWIIKVSADSLNQVRKIKITVGQLDPKITIISWIQVSDF
ncbi:MAG: hypothetical protein Q7T34_02955 [Candidatus Parcubacteria bacterium]|nr:hypothetical protein [Candidatus Parcubacteria bacterium]